MLKKISWLWWLCLFLGFAFDFLFWNKSPGISFAIYTALTILLGLWLARESDARPAWSSLLLLIPIACFALMSFIRQEGFSRFLNFWLTLGLMVLFASSFVGGRWVVYRAWDYVISSFKLAVNSLSLPAVRIARSRNEYRGSGKRLVPYLRGVLFALPILLVFTPLLSSADPVFSSAVRRVMEALRIEYLPEYVFRLSIVLLSAYMLAGVYLHAITASDDRQWLKPGSPLPFGLGFVEAASILLSVNALFSVFVAIQFRYFFGGQTNIGLGGFTYAEYARRGFGELLAVAFFSLLLFLALSTIARRQGGKQRGLFSLLGVWLVVMVSVMQVSSFQRLLLYEQAYGFTRLRTYTHVFIIWLGVLLVALLALELLSRLQVFPLVVLLVVLGFGLSINVLNVDRFIAQQNIRRAQAGQKLDLDYLGSLSNDAVPAIARIFQSRPADDPLRDDLGGLLACRAALLDEQAGELSWQSFHLARYHARNALLDLRSDLGEYPVGRSDYGARSVTVAGEERQCTRPWPE